MNGAIAIVAGGAGYLGGAVALELAQSGWRVTVLDRAKPSVVDPRIAFKEVDLQDSLMTEQAIMSTVRENGRLDGLVCAAGTMQIEHDTLQGFAAPEVWIPTLAANTLVTTNPIQHALTSLIETQGSIVIIGSLVAQQGSATAQPAYTASKGAITAFARDLAVSLAPQRVRVNVVAPGPLAGGLFPVSQGTQEKARLRSIPMGRRGQAEEISPIVRFLLTPEASYITGATVAVDGGASAAFIAAQPT